jgi:hypothetical protein
VIAGSTPIGVERGSVVDEGVAFIQKPFSSRALAAKVRKMLAE